MTFREGYEAISLRLKKRKAPAIYPEDYTYYVNSAIQDRCNIMYANYEKTQLLSDDLQNLSRHVIINIDDDVPFPFNIINIDGTPLITFSRTYDMNNNGAGGFFSHYVDGLNPTDPNISTFINEAKYRMQSDNNISILENSLFEVTDINYTPNSILDQIIFDKIYDGIIIGIKSKIKIRDYRYSNNTNYLPFGFNLFDQGDFIYSSETNIKYFKYNQSTGMFDYIYGSGFTNLDDSSMLIHAPNDYWHATGMTSKLGYKKNITCDKEIDIKIGVKRLTDQVRANINTDTNVYLHPSIKRKNNYFHELNSLQSVYPDIELLYCSENEKNLVTLKQVILYYLKEPKKYVLTDADCRGVDNTESFEFQDYICQEIIEQTELLLLERDSNPRLQTQQAINNTNDQVRAQK